MRALSEATGIALWAGAAFLLIMLLSYDLNAPTQNLMGVWGGLTAHILYYFLGYASFVLVALIFQAGYTFFVATQNHAKHISERIIRYLSALMLLLSAATLFSIRLGSALQLPASAGGEIGRILAANMTNLLGDFGSVLILFFLCLISFGLFTGLSWLWALEQIGALCLKITHKAKLLRASSIINEQEAPTIQRANTKGPLLSKNSKKAFILKNRPRRIEPRFAFKPGQSLLKRPMKNKQLGEDSASKPNDDSQFMMKEQTNPFSGIAQIMRNLGKNPPKIATKNRSDHFPKKLQETPSSSMASQIRFPAADCLAPTPISEQTSHHQNYEALQQQLVEKLSDFGIDVEPMGYNSGPVVTLFELQPAAGVKASRISNLATDLARSLTVDSIRVLEIMPGKSSIGVEIPNFRRRTVSLREVLTSSTFTEFSGPLPLALGKDTEGKSVVASLAEMPHLLVAGTTGSGKSVGINAMLLSLLYKHGPNRLRLILVDPKMLELAAYNDIPHLLVPVITDMREASKAINWCVREMDKRYRMMTECGARSIIGYNHLIAQKNKEGEAMPYLVVVIDEYADMIMINKKIEKEIVRIAQKARAAGIHLILATQRPSVDVITGLIKANIPARISFKVSAKVDSRTILDQNGAEQLLGMGDMLYVASGSSMPLRVHGQFVQDKEIQAITEHWKKQGQPQYRQDVLITGSAVAGENSNVDEEEDELYPDALAFIRTHNRISISSVQRQFKIGYNRAARLIELMEKNGIVSEMDNTGKRILLS